MRTYEEYQRILQLWEKGNNQMAIARITGIPRGTVKDCIKRYGNLEGLEAQKAHANKSTPDHLLKRIQETPEVRKAYAYALGLYLGDGYIDLMKNGRSYRLRISLDKKYPGIIESCENALQMVLFQNKINRLSQPGCYHVCCYNKHLPVIFPQHGEGRKHDRPIVLEAWQQSIVDEHPLEFFRGLYHSDGTRAPNIVKGKDYPRYTFINNSEDILQLFKDACDKLGLHWTTKSEKRTTRVNLVFVSRRADVAYLDEVIGPKQ